MRSWLTGSVLLGLPWAAIAQDTPAPAEPAAEADVAVESAAPAEVPTVAAPTADQTAAELDQAELEALRERLRALEEQVDVLRGTDDEQEPQEIPLDLETKVHGYADIGMVAYTSNRPPGFQVGDFVVSYAANLDRRVHVTADLIFGLEHLGDWLATLDRLHIQFDVSDALKITAGKLQSPFGYWSTNLAYGSYLYAPYSRPYVLQFERHGSAIATRQTGIDIHGSLPLGFWRWGYHTGISNGRAPHLVQTQDIGDGSWYKTTWAQVWVESPNGIQLGLTGVYDPIRVGKMSMDYSEDVGDQGDTEMVHTSDENPALTEDVDEYLGVFHVAWRGDRMQLLSEFFLVAHRFQTDATSTAIEINRNAYLQWSHEYGATTPYVRVDYTEWWKDDPVYQDLGKLKTQGVLTTGLRYDVALRAALKFETYAQTEVSYANPDDIKEEDILDPSIALQEDRQRVGAGVYLTVGF